MLAHQVVTRQLTVEQLRERVPEIQDLLLGWGQVRVNVAFGWGSNLPMDQLWVRTEIAASSLESFINDASRKGKFEIGRSDLHIEDAHETFEFRLCHESDIHFEGIDQTLVNQVITLWRGRGLGLQVSTGPKGSGVPTVWTPIDPEAGRR